MRNNKFSVIVALCAWALLLGACACVTPLHNNAIASLIAAQDQDDSDSAAPADDLGRIRVKGDRAWMDHVSVSTDNPLIRPMLKDVIQQNFSVRVVQVPGSWIIVRILSCSDDRTIRLCPNVQFNSRITKLKSLERKLDKTVDRKTRQKLEQELFDDDGAQDQFLYGVAAVFDRIQSRGQ